MSGGSGAWSDSPYRDNSRCPGGAAGWSGHVGLRESRRGLGQPDARDDAAPGQGDAGATAPPTDSAVLTGGSSPTGTITFTLFVNAGGTPVDAETVAKPGKTVVAGSALTDSAQLTNGASPTGTVTFRLHDPDGHVVYVTVSGNGSYTTAGDHPGGFIPAVAGTYQWVAAYSGDSRNKAVSTRKGDEPEWAVYGFGGFLSPAPKPRLKSGSTINVRFRPTNTAGQPITRAVAVKRASGHDVTTTLTGRGIRRRSVSCTRNSAHRFFQCKIKTPRGVRTGRANPYLITAFENVGAESVRAIAVLSASTPNPETVFFKKTRAR